jgi:hypothetical protein
VKRRYGFGLGSYLKTTATCLVFIAVALLSAVLGEYWVPMPFGPVLVAVAGLITLCATTLAFAGAVVLLRQTRGALGKRDLFLDLNQSREPAAIKAAGMRRSTPWRRWLARGLLGHDLVVGDLVEVKTWAEIRTTLDERGCLEQLPFMPEMLRMCGQRAFVFRSMHRLFDYRKSRRMRHMNDAVLLVDTVCDGANHGGCDAGCHAIWKSAWLRRLEPGEGVSDARTPAEPAGPPPDSSILHFGTQPPRYSCQLTQLNAASLPIEGWGLFDFVRPLIAGNVAPAAFVVGRLTHLFNELQQKRQGVTFPAFDSLIADDGGVEATRLMAGDQVVVRSSAEIRATLNDRFEHRGLGFELDMLKHCGQRCHVEAQVARLVDIVTGEMRTMKTPAYVLRDIHFSGERQLFNAQYEPLFWRAVWLRQEGGQSPAVPAKKSHSIHEVPL